MLKNLYSKINESTNLFMLSKLSKFIIGAVGIIISIVSLKNSVHIFRSMVKYKSYVGNEPYLAAVSLNSVICIFILIWIFKIVISIFQESINSDIPVPSGFGDYDGIERSLVRRQSATNENFFVKIAKKDKLYIRNFLFFMFFLIICHVVKWFIPDELFWNINLTPDFFSFPLFFIVILAVVAALRFASIYFRKRSEKLKMEVTEVTKLIKGKWNPYTFAVEIEKALHPIQQNGKPNILYTTPSHNRLGNSLKRAGSIQKKLFIETHPKYTPIESSSIVYLYLVFAVILFIIGFFFLAKTPPDNISVLSVPAIAIGYLWTIVKGIVIVVIGGGLLKYVSLGFEIFRFESIMIYLYVETELMNEDVKDNVEELGEEGILIHGDYHFKVFSAKLLTEIDTTTSKRFVVKMSIDDDSIKAKNLVIDAIETHVR